jgi:hypothetical protein
MDLLVSLKLVELLNVALHLHRKALELLGQLQNLLKAALPCV